MNGEEELRFKEWIEKENKVYRLNREGELRLTDWIEKEKKGLQDE